MGCGTDSNKQSRPAGAGEAPSWESTKPHWQIETECFSELAVGNKIQLGELVYTEDSDTPRAGNCK